MLHPLIVVEGMFLVIASVLSIHSYLLLWVEADNMASTKSTILKKAHTFPEIWTQDCPLQMVLTDALAR